MLGAHVSKTDYANMSTALNSAFRILRGFGVKTPIAQIFVTGPQNYKETLSAEDKKVIATDYAGQIYIHGAYVDHPWSRASASIHNIKQEMRIAAAIGAQGVIVHLSMHANDADNIAHVVNEISKLPADVLRDVVLFLEVNAAKPTLNTFETPAKLNALMVMVDHAIEAVTATAPRQILRVGLCVDTAHLYSCGVALTTRSQAEEWMAAFEKNVLAPRSVPLMFHLNDSASKIASGIDRHACLCRGNIWKAYHPADGTLPFADSGLSYLLEWSSAHAIPIILERHKSDTISDLSLLTTAGYFT